LTVATTEWCDGGMSMGKAIVIPPQRPLPAQWTWAPLDWCGRPIRPIPPPVVDRDPGDEHPTVRFLGSILSTIGGNVRFCKVCCLGNDWTSPDHSRCRYCHVPLEEPFVPATFTRAELYGR
jgi:hypothetical protein